MDFAHAAAFSTSPSNKEFSGPLTKNPIGSIIISAEALLSFLDIFLEASPDMKLFSLVSNAAALIPLNCPLFKLAKKFIIFREGLQILIGLPTISKSIPSSSCKLKSDTAIIFVSFPISFAIFSAIILVLPSVESYKTSAFIFFLLNHYFIFCFKNFFIKNIFAYIYKKISRFYWIDRNIRPAYI